MLFKLIPFFVVVAAVRQAVSRRIPRFYVDFWNKVMGWLSDTHLLCAGCRLQAAKPKQFTHKPEELESVPNYAFLAPFLYRLCSSYFHLLAKAPGLLSGC